MKNIPDYLIQPPLGQQRLKLAWLRVAVDFFRNHIAGYFAGSDVLLTSCKLNKNMFISRLLAINVAGSIASRANFSESKAHTENEKVGAGGTAIHQ